MTPTPEVIGEKERGVSSRGVPPKEQTVDPRQAAQLEAARLKELEARTYRRPDGRPPERKDFEGFSRQYNQMATTERHTWRFVGPDGKQRDTSWTGLNSAAKARAFADLNGLRVMGEVIPGPTVEGTPQTTRGTERGTRLTPPPLVQAEPPYSPPPLIQAEPPYSPPPLIQAEPPPPDRIFMVPLPESTRIDDDHRGLKRDSRALNRRAGREPAPSPASRPQKKPTPDAGVEDAIAKRVRELRDIDPPPRKAADKLKPVHNITPEHQEKVRDVVNWAIQAAQRAQPGAGLYNILTTAQVTIANLRESAIPDAGDNLIYRDADHSLAARTQEYKLKTALLASLAKKLAGLPWSTEANTLAVGPWGVNQAYETMKLQQFTQEAKGVPAKQHASALGGTEWELLGMIDFERYDLKDSGSAPHLLGDLPGKGERFATSPEVPPYLREEAKRLVDKMGRDAKFMK